MSTGTPPRELIIRRVRITGLAGPAPSAEAVRQALVDAFRAGSSAQGAAQAQLKPGATLTDAAGRVAAIVRGSTE